MGIPRWRHVQYDDDGVEIYQCLMCKGKFWVAGWRPLEDWKCCPMCCIRWEGEHKCRNHNIPRWAVDHWGLDENGELDGNVPYSKLYPQHSDALEMSWVLEEKHSYLEGCDWEYSSTIKTNPTRNHLSLSHAYQAYRDLEFHRRGGLSLHGNTEYRITTQTRYLARP